MIKKINGMLVLAITLSGFPVVADDASASGSDSGWKKKFLAAAGVAAASVIGY
jgi:hypothetical protein